MNKSISSPEQRQHNKIIPWHPLFNRWLKCNFTPAKIAYNENVTSISEPPEIDAVLSHEGTKWSKQQRALLPDGIRNRRMSYHLLEFKVTESVNRDAAEQAFGYDYLYRRSQSLAKNELQTYLISAKTPRATTLEEWGYEVTRYPGVYVSSKPFFDRITILVLNQLRDLPHNQFFRLFASRKKVRESALSYLIAEHERAYLISQGANGGEHPEDILLLNKEQLDEKWSVLYALRRIYELEGIRMDIEMTLDEVLEMGRAEYRKSILELVPVQDRMAGLDPAERMAGLDPKERMAGLDPKERMAGLDPKERMAGLDPKEIVNELGPEEIVQALEPEDMVRLMQEIERFLAIQKAASPNEEGVSESEKPVGESLNDKKADRQQ